MSLLNEPKLYQNIGEKQIINTSLVKDETPSASGALIKSLSFHDLAVLSKDTYVGYSSSEVWLVAKTTETGQDLSTRYAKLENNATRTTYADAWANRLTLTYELLEDI